MHERPVPLRSSQRSWGYFQSDYRVLLQWQLYYKATTKPQGSAPAPSCTLGLWKAWVEASLRLKLERLSSTSLCVWGVHSAVVSELFVGQRVVLVCVSVGVAVGVLNSGEGHFWVEGGHRLSLFLCFFNQLYRSFNNNDNINKNERFSRTQSQFFYVLTTWELTKMIKITWRNPLLTH